MVKQMSAKIHCDGAGGGGTLKLGLSSLADVGLQQCILPVTVVVLGLGLFLAS